MPPWRRCGVVVRPRQGMVGLRARVATVVVVRARKVTVARISCRREALRCCTRGVQLAVVVVVLWRAGTFSIRAAEVRVVRRGRGGMCLARRGPFKVVVPLRGGRRAACWHRRTGLAFARAVQPVVAFFL